jgi:hypothetical protein
MIEIGTRVTVSTLFGTYAGTVYSYDEASKMYTILRDDDGVTPPELRLIGSTIVTPIEQEQQP